MRGLVTSVLLKFTIPDNSVGIATDYSLVGWVSILDRDKILSSLYSVKANFGGHEVSYAISTGGIFLQEESSRCLKLTFQLQADDKNGGTLPPHPQRLHDVGIN